MGDVAAVPTRRRRRSVALTAEQAVEVAFELAQSQGVEGLKMRQVADRLGVDVSALYRAFQDKDDLLLAVYDRATARVLEEIGDVPADEPWPQTIRRIAAAVWNLAEQAPAICSLMFARTTGGPAERRFVELVLTTLSRAGFPPAETVRYYRAVIDAATGLAAQAAVLSTLDPEVRIKDATAWTRIYAQLPKEEYPTARSHVEELVAADRRRVYDTVIEAIIAAASRELADTGGPA